MRFWAAARFIGCTTATIINAKKNLKEKGVHKPIKKRYLVNLYLFNKIRNILSLHIYFFCDPFRGV